MYVTSGDWLVAHTVSNVKPTIQSTVSIFGIKPPRTSLTRVNPGYIVCQVDPEVVVTPELACFLHPVGTDRGLEPFQVRRFVGAEDVNLTELRPQEDGTIDGSLCDQEQRHHLSAPKPNETRHFIRHLISLREKERNFIDREDTVFYLAREFTRERHLGGQVLFDLNGNPETGLVRLVHERIPVRDGNAGIIPLTQRIKNEESRALSQKSFG